MNKDQQRIWIRVWITYLVLGLCLWPLPLLNILHVESSAVVAFFAFFIAGVSSMHFFRLEGAFTEVLRLQLGALLIPWALLTITLFWQPNCGYLQGLMFFLLFPGITVVLAVSLAYALNSAGKRRRHLVVIGLAIAALTPLYDLGLHPQFYVYNHVLGGVLGPIYDEELAIRWGLFTFRGLTLLWALLCYLAGRRLQERVSGESSRRILYALGLVSVMIGLMYLFSSALGFNTTPHTLQRQLGGHYATPHFDIYYDPSVLEAQELRFLADEHEFQYARLTALLSAEVEGRIASYLYPDAATKARLTGARLTNVAPVWLRAPQVHVLYASFDQVFAHELAHVFSREFGLPGLNASLRVGLVEGLAVALEPPDGNPTPHEQVIAAALMEVEPGDMQALTLAEDLSSRLSPLGFWTGRGAVSYTTMGSFVRYLLDTYGARPLKQVYARGQFEQVYGKPVVELAREWQAFLLRLPVIARDAAPLAVRRFSVPSLFERDCPHHIPAYRRHFRKGMEALVETDTLSARVAFEKALQIWPSYPAVLSGWARVQLANGAPVSVVERLDTLDAEHRGPALWFRLGDAYALMGKVSQAEAAYDEVLKRLPLSAHEDDSRVLLRKALAEHPEVVEVLVSTDSLHQKAKRLAPLRTLVPGYVDWVRAYLLAEAGAYQQAASLLQAHSLPEHPALSLPKMVRLNRQRIVWLADYTLRSGDLEASSGYAAQAARAFQAVGAVNEADRWETHGTKARWLR